MLVALKYTATRGRMSVLWSLQLFDVLSAIPVVIPLPVPSVLPHRLKAAKNRRRSCKYSSILGNSSATLSDPDGGHGRVDAGRNRCFH
jgi:hypothetical protein